MLCCLLFNSWPLAVQTFARLPPHVCNVLFMPTQGSCSRPPPCWSAPFPDSRSDRCDRSHRAAHQFHKNARACVGLSVTLLL
jgi:hypothetical protein